LSAVTSSNVVPSAPAVFKSSRSARRTRRAPPSLSPDVRVRTRASRRRAGPGAPSAAGGPSPLARLSQVKFNCLR
jgi:hypothetical protein